MRGAWHLAWPLLLLLLARVAGLDETDTPSLGHDLLQQPREDDPEEEAESCEAARLKCAYRVGCGMALQNYLLGCSLVHHDDPLSKRCPEPCQHALIALTSTVEGKHLMSCRCADEPCEQTKRRVEVCRPQVQQATNNDTIVSCRVAQWICAADPLCSTALDFYHRLCRAMFHGKRCSHRCNNSLAILLRQENAAKLATCRCDGSEDYDCARIRGNMERLCLHKTPTVSISSPAPGLDTNEVDPARLSSACRRDASLNSWHAVLLLLFIVMSLLHNT